MEKIVFSLAVITGVGMFAVALLGPPATNEVAAHENTTQAIAKGCRVQEVTLDEGYGVSRKVAIRKCATQ